MTVRYRRLDRPPGIAFQDAHAGRRVHIETGNRPDLADAGGPEVDPADVCVSVRADRLEFPEIPVGQVRGPSNDIRHPVTPEIDETLDRGRYRIELHASMKVFLEVAGPARVVASEDRLRIAFPDVRRVPIAVRSYQDAPSATVTTTDRPADLLAAVSTFGAGLDSLSVERSYPTLRRYPPCLELGDELAIPPELDVPSSGIRLELPATPRAAFVAAPAAYYLAAECVPAGDARLTTEHGFKYPLEPGDALPESIARLLGQAFLMDVVVRTEGFYDARLDERAAIEPLIDEPLEDLYRQPIDVRLEAYLSIPYADIAEYVPRWGVVADVPCEPSDVGMLAHLAHRLAIVRPASRARRLTDREVRRELLGERSSNRGASRGEAPEVPVVKPPDSEAVEHVWFGAGIPIGAIKGVPAAYERRPATASGGDAIEIVVVRNGEVGEAEQDRLETAYGETAYLTRSIVLHRDLGTDELAALLRSPADFFHYVGHVDPAGFRCPDGHLDATNLDDVGPKAFLLNACDSHAQGVALVEGGSAGGVVTFGEVGDTDAARLGVTMARLLHRGFPLQPAHAIACRDGIAGLQYLVVGDGGVDLAQSPHRPPILCEAVPVADGDSVDVTIHASLPQEAGMGILAVPYLGDAEHGVPPGEIATVRVPREDLADFVDRFGGVVRIDDTLRWSAEEVLE